MPEVTDALPGLLRRQIELLHARDLDGLVDQYQQDAVIMRPGAVARGRAQVRAFFTAYLAQEPTITAVTSVESTDDLILYQAEVTLGGQPRRTAGTLALAGGKIWRQTALVLA